MTMADPAETRDPLDVLTVELRENLYAVVDHDGEWYPSSLAADELIRATFSRIRQQAYAEATETAIKAAGEWAGDVFHYEQCSLEECERCDEYLLSPLETIEEKIRSVIPAIPQEPASGAAQRDRTVRKLAEWLHWKLSAAQNLPYEDGDTCPDCVSTVENELLPISYFPKAAPIVQRGPLRQSDSAASELTGEKLREIVLNEHVRGYNASEMLDYDWDAIATKVEASMRVADPSHAKLARLSALQAAALASALGQLVKKRDEWSSEPFRLRKPCADSLAPIIALLEEVKK
jgi:hypothetical protein